MRIDMRKFISLFMCLIFALAVTGCEAQNTKSAKMQKYEKQYFDVFDTVTTLTVYAESEEKANEYFNAVYEKLLYLHKLFDPYNTYEGMVNLKTLNDRAGEKKQRTTEPELVELFMYGKRIHGETDGAINIAMGATLEVWHKYRDDALENGNIAVPTKEELEVTRQFDDISAVETVPTTNSAFIAEEGVSVNLGCIAKGYATGRAIKILKDMGCDSALVNLGGNVSCYRGNAKDGPWRIGVQDANDPENIIDVVETDSGSLVSSGDYQRYYECDGKRYHHIIDPETLMPAAQNKGTTVVCGEDISCVDADMLSTALFILPRDKADALALKYNVKQVYYTDKDGNVELLK